MHEQVSRAGLAAYFIAAAFAVHLANQFWFEPRMGFERIADYATAAKLAVGLRSDSWLWSGYAHFVTGWALPVLALAAWRVSSARPLAAAFTAAFGILAALAYLFTSVIDVPGRGILGLITQMNPLQADSMVLASAYVRSVVNALAIVATGLFILHFNWTLRSQGKVPWPYGLFGYLTGLTALALMFSPIAYGLSYLLIPLWAAATGFVLRANAHRIAGTQP